MLITIGHVSNVNDKIRAKGSISLFAHASFFVYRDSPTSHAVGRPLISIQAITEQKYGYLRMPILPSRITDETIYSDLCQRIDTFIQDRLERGDHEPSVRATETILNAVYEAFPGERDALATFCDRIASMRLPFVEDLSTGESVFVGIRLKPDTP